MNPKAMHEALKRNKAKGLDITILLGHPGEGEKLDTLGSPNSEDDDSKELNMAPDATPLGEEQDEKDEALGKMGHHDNMTPGEELINHPDAEQDKKLMEEEMAKAHFGKRSLAHHVSKGRGAGMMGKKY